MRVRATRRIGADLDYDVEMVRGSWIALLLVALGCGDGIDCPDNLGLALVSPSADGPVTLAADRSGRPGVQVDVELSSVLQGGEAAELVVTGADGGEERHQALANDEGELTFPLVTLPTGDVGLSVHAVSQRCGEDTFVTALSVLGPACALDLAEDQVETDYYDVDVLNRASDSDTDAPGFQAHVGIASEEGYEVELFTIYGDSQSSAGSTVASNGAATIPVTLVQGMIALVAECHSTETTDSATTLPHDFFVDTIAPECAFESPDDGSFIGPGLDEAPDAGVQVTVRARLTGDDVSGEPSTFSTGGESVAGSAVDEVGATSALVSFEHDGPVALDFSGRDHALNPCSAGIGVSVVLAGLAVAFDDPVASGVVGPADGSVVAGDLELEVCGMVSEPPDSVTVTVDGAPGIDAEVSGNSFCAPVTLAESPPAHAVSALARAADRMATVAVDLIVDLTAPAAPSGLALSGVDRQALEISLVAPSDGESQVAAYEMRLADRPLTAANFDSTGVALSSPSPAAPGTLQSFQVDTLQAGRRYYLGARAVDAGGNRSDLVGAGPIVLRFDATGPISAGDAAGRLGAALASGRLGGDGYSDLAVGAPLDDAGERDSGRVRVFAGGAAGIPASPARSYAGPARDARFGAAVAVLDWNGDGQDDLAVGAPGSGGGSGRVYLYFGPLAGGAADAIISVAPGSTLLAGAGIGASLAPADFDGDGTDDLAIGAPDAAGARGAVILVFGGASGPIRLDDSDPLGPPGYLIAEPAGITAGRFGEHLFGLGPTENALDPDDDIGIGYRDEDVAFVIRGRARPASGLVALTFASSDDLRLDNDAGSDQTTAFGAAMGTLEDQDGDGDRELLVSSWRQGLGRLVVVSGGLSGVRSIPGPSVRTTITGSGSGAFRIGLAIAENRLTGAPDVDRDGREDLVFAGDVDRLQIFVFYGDDIPTGTVGAGAAPYRIGAPPSFRGDLPFAQGSPAALTWAGDVNADGLDDLALGDPAAAAFEVLWDE